MSTFVIGDIHGTYRALKQCLERANVDYANDTVIVLGDVCDGWPEVKESVTELLKIQNLVYIMGNHDYWFYEWLKYGKKDNLWLCQGGQATIESYDFDDVPDQHKRLFNTSPFKYEIITEEYKALFVHGGFSYRRKVEEESIHDLMWDRTLYRHVYELSTKGSCNCKIGKYNDIFIGHTQTGTEKPIHYCNVWNLDQGAGWDGWLTIMNVYTKEIWTSDCVLDLYKDIGHNRRRQYY